MRLLAAAVFVLGVAAHRVDACGFWSMTDTEKHLDIGWLVNSASIEHDKQRRAALYLDIDNKPGIRVAQDHKVVYDIKGGTVVRYGKPIAKLKDNTVAFGKRVYTIELSDHDVKERVMHTWKLVVKRGDVVVVTSDLAAGLCSAMHGDPADMQARAEDEVRRRVIYYLAWRETGL